MEEEGILQEFLRLSPPAGRVSYASCAYPSTHEFVLMASYTIISEGIGMVWFGAIMAFPMATAMDPHFVCHYFCLKTMVDKTSVIIIVIAIVTCELQ